MFNLHEQPTDLSALAHTFNSWILSTFGLLWIIEYLIGLHTNSKHHTYVQRITNHPRLSGQSKARKFFAVGEDSLGGIFSAYTNPVVFTTMIPSAKSVVILLCAIWWFVMATFFETSFEEQVHKQFLNSFNIEFLASTKWTYGHCKRISIII